MLIGQDVVRWQISSATRGGCDLMHVACHAAFDEDSPDSSGVRLADGTILSAREMQQARLTGSLAVLSACESGRLDVRAGDELTGLANSLMLAGFTSVVAAGWRIPDDATAVLMAGFYGAVRKGENLARALQHAQLAVLDHKEFAAPVNWAAFRLFGGWRNPFGEDAGA
jgi:CHAT domain-containing protein